MSRITTVTVTTKRQITLSKALMDNLGTNKGDKISAEIVAGQVILKPLGRGILDLAGTFGRLKLPKGKSLERLVDEARNENFRKSVR